LKQGGKEKKGAEAMEFDRLFPATVSESYEGTGQSTTGTGLFEQNITGTRRRENQAEQLDRLAMPWSGCQNEGKHDREACQKKIVSVEGAIVPVTVTIPVLLGYFRGRQGHRVQENLFSTPPGFMWSRHTGRPHLLQMTEQSSQQGFPQTEHFCTCWEQRSVLQPEHLKWHFAHTIWRHLLHRQTRQCRHSFRLQTAQTTTQSLQTTWLEAQTTDSFLEILAPQFEHAMMELPEIASIWVVDRTFSPASINVEKSNLSVGSFPLLDSTHFAASPFNGLFKL